MQKSALNTLSIAEQILVDLDTPLSLSIYILMQDGSDDSWDQIFNYEFCPTHYTEVMVDRARRDLCAISLLSKVPNFLERDLKGVALENFERGEAGCRLTNERIRANWHNPDLDLVASKLKTILGKAPSLEYCFSSSDFGPGSSAALSRRLASADYKACFETSITSDCARALSAQCSRWPIDLAERALQLIPGNLVATVIKNAKTDRTIAIEAGFNSRAQKGAGDSIRRKLLRFGVDLNDQTLNQRAAATALRFKRATLDLKNASGSIASFLVMRLLAEMPDWFDLLYSLRSHRYTTNTRAEVLNGTNCEWHEYESWSSMGNGYTFELETAIFTAVVLAAGVDSDQFFIYGDDIIVPQDKCRRVIELLEECGFTLNSSKSFTEGLFFESCGVYSFNGADITPVKIKDYVHDIPHALVLANKLRAYASLDQHDILDKRVLPAYRMCLGRLRDECFMSLYRRDCARAKRKNVPRKSRRALLKLAAEMLHSLRGPIGVEGCLHSHIDEARPHYSRKRGGLVFNVIAYSENERTTDVGSLLSRRESQIIGDPHGFSSQRKLSAKLFSTAKGFWVLPSSLRTPDSTGNVVKKLVSKDTKLCRTSIERWSDALNWK